MMPPVRAAGEVRVAVVGAGSWGTAFASVVAGKGVPTTLWARRPELAEAISERHENPDYLAGATLPPRLRATVDLEEALAGAAVVVMAVPSHAFREIFRAVAPMLRGEEPVVSLSKGIEQGSMKRMTEVLAEEGGLPPGRVAALSGPNLAREIAAGQPSATVVGCADADAAALLQSTFMGPTFRVYTNHDVVGVELGGAMKNVVAIAAGMAAGMGFGDNAKASLITRGLAEIARLGVRMGGEPLTFAGLAGMGDLVATCYSPLSRNRTVGEQLGMGRSLEDIQAEMRMVAEGVKSCRPLCLMAERKGVEVPIAQAVVRVLYGGLRPQDMARSLLERDAKPELHGIG
jgi:glycerol-3-phosphate dehydrogenase (NAD(P)+)